MTSELRRHLATTHGRPGFTDPDYAKDWGRTEEEVDKMAVAIHGVDHRDAEDAGDETYHAVDDLS